MERRKFITGLGALATGSAAAMGTGAFTSVQADRSVEVATAGDGSALLGFETSGAANSTYVDTTGGGANEVSVDIDSLNVDSTTQLNDLFAIRNNGTQPAVVYVDPSSIASEDRTTTGSGLTIDPQATNRPNGDYTKTSSVGGGVEDDQISLTGLYNDPPYEYSAYNDEGDVDDAIEEFVLEAGESFEFGLYVNSNGGDGNGGLSDSTEITIVADTTVVPETYTGDDS